MNLQEKRMFTLLQINKQPYIKKSIIRGKVIYIQPLISGVMIYEQTKIINSIK